MGRLVDVDDLVGVEELRRRLGLRYNTDVHRMRHRRLGPPFPEHVKRVQAGPHGAYLWLWSEVEAWGRATGRYPPPPAAPQGSGEPTRAGDRSGSSGRSSGAVR